MNVRMMVCLTVVALALAATVEAQDAAESDLLVLPNGKAVSLSVAKYRILKRLHKRHAALRPAIEAEYARRCDPVALAEADRSASIAHAEPPSTKSEPYAAAGENIGRALSIGLAESERARNLAYCSAADRLRARQEAEAHVLAAEQEFLKRVDALMFHGMSQERAERAAANDDIYKAELARLQKEAVKP